MVRVASGHDGVTYENVIEPTIVDEEYEPIETTPNQPAGAIDPAAYENVQQPSYENIDRNELVPSPAPPAALPALGKWPRVG